MTDTDPNIVGECRWCMGPLVLIERPDGTVGIVSACPHCDIAHTGSYCRTCVIVNSRKA